MNNIKKGMLHTDTIEETEEDEINTQDNFVEVAIADKSGYTWKAQGKAGLIVVTTDVHTEVDAIGSTDDMVKLLATALIKVRELTKNPEIVDQAITQYRKTLL